MFKSWWKDAQEMKKTLFMFLLFSYNHVFANWTPVSQGANGDLFSIDYSTLKEISGYTRILVLENYKNPLTSSYNPMGYNPKVYSSKVIEEFDCTQSKVRTVSTILYLQPNAGGPPLGSPSANLAWRFVMPETNTFHIMSAVCKDKLINRGYRGKAEGAF
jgi:hypothetical protein